MVAAGDGGCQVTYLGTSQSPEAHLMTSHLMSHLSLQNGSHQVVNSHQKARTGHTSAHMIGERGQAAIDQGSS